MRRIAGQRLQPRLGRRQFDQDRQFDPRQTRQGLRGLGPHIEPRLSRADDRLAVSRHRQPRGAIGPFTDRQAGLQIRQPRRHAQVQRDLPIPASDLQHGHDQIHGRDRGVQPLADPVRRARLQPDQIAQPDLRPDRGRGQLAQRPAVLAARHPLQHPQRTAGVDLGRQKPVVVANLDAQIGRQGVGEPQQIDVQINQTTIVHDAERHLGAGQTAEHLIGHAAVQSRQTRPDRDHGLGRPAARRRRGPAGDPHLIAAQQQRREEHRCAAGDLDPCGVRLHAARHEPVIARLGRVGRIDAQRRRHRDRDVGRHIGLDRRLGRAQDRTLALRQVSHRRQRREIRRPLNPARVQNQNAQVDHRRREQTQQTARDRRDHRHSPAPIGAEPEQQTRRSDAHQ